MLYGRGNLAQLLWWEGGEISLPACSQSQQGLLFFSVQLSALVWQLAAYIEVDFTERDRRGDGVGGMHFCEAECDNQALCQCQKAEREVSLIAGKTCIPLEFNESGAGVRLCE